MRFRRKLGIMVDNQAGDGDLPPSQKTGLDPSALHGSDRREFLKLFSKVRGP